MQHREKIKQILQAKNKKDIVSGSHNQVNTSRSVLRANPQKTSARAFQDMIDKDKKKLAKLRQKSNHTLKNTVSTY